MDSRNPLIFVACSVIPGAGIGSSHESALRVIGHHSSDKYVNAIGGFPLLIIEEVCGFDGVAMFLFILLMVERSFMGKVELSISGYAYEPVDLCRILKRFLMLGIISLR